MGKIISVISDTHGLLREEVKKQLHNSDVIIHLGDVGKVGVLNELKGIAPLFVIKGNVDEGREVLMDLEKELDIDYEGFRFKLIHNLKELNFDLDNRPDIVFYGHSHMPYEKLKEEILYINPGSIGPKRFSLPISFVKILIEGRKCSTLWLEF